MNFTPKKEKYETPKHLKSESLPPHEKTVDSKKKQEQKSKEIDFEEDEKHLHCIMSAALVYLRSTVCSHMIYSLFEKTAKIELL